MHMIPFGITAELSVGFKRLMEMAQDHEEEDATDAESFQGMCANTAQASNQYSQFGLGMTANILHP